MRNDSSVGKLSAVRINRRMKVNHLNTDCLVETGYSVARITPTDRCSGSGTAESRL
jgi:hypothetical protein